MRGPATLAACLLLAACSGEASEAGEQAAAIAEPGLDDSGGVDQGAEARCETAWASYRDALRGASRRPPAPEAFAEVCRALPPVVQRCLAMDYALAHAAECAEARRDLDPALRRRLRDLGSS